MPFREQLKGIRGRLEEKARRALGSEGSRTRPTNSALDPWVVAPTVNPTPKPSTAPAGGSTATSVSIPPISEIHQTWASLKCFLQVLEKCSGVYGPLKMAMEGLVQCFDMHEATAAARRDYEELKLQLETLFSDLSTHFSGNVPPTMTASVDNLCAAIESELVRISSKQGRQTGRQHLEAKKDLDDVMECYRRIHGHLERLTLNTDLNIWKIVDEQATENRLKSLMPSMSACYNSVEAALVRRRECTPRTREKVLAELSDWRHNRNQGNMYWLNGMAGTGKTTIANSLCAMLDRAHELGASFFCTRQLPECRNVKFIIPTIAYQLARFSRPFCYALSRVLERDPDIYTRALPIQLDGLIVSPLREVSRTLPTDLVVVIDALDECNDSNGVEQILGMFVRHASELPCIGSMKSQLILHELDESIVKGDIERYLRTELMRMSLSDSQLAALVKRAGVLFIYAATVVRYIGEDNFSLNPTKRLDNVLAVSATRSSNKYQEIDELYTLVLSSALDNPKLEDFDKDVMKLVLHTVICAQEPLTAHAISRLLQLDDNSEVYSALRGLWSVMHISGTNRPVTTLHASFTDYMLDLDRSKGYNCDPEVHHGIIAELCFERVKRNKSQFNICGLESSYLADEQVVDFDEKVKKEIPLDLMYVCQYWAVHLELGGRSSKRMQLLDEFLSTRLLMWMEVLNLKKRMSTGVALLGKAREWCTKEDGLQELKNLVYDAWRFVTMFAANPLSLSTPHIYVSMLVFWPRTSSLANYYLQRTKRLTDVGGTGMARRQLVLLSVLTVQSKVFSVAFTPTGLRIVCRPYGQATYVWDAQNGQTALGPLEGHTNVISSAAFSHDGMRIASGSMEIYVWDAQDRQMKQGPLKGNTGCVSSIAFSADGMRIVSGSHDKKIFIWDVQNGQVALGPLARHTNTVHSVSFSPDGMFVLSNDYDGTICVWDAQNGQLVWELLERYTYFNSVNSVAFSPDSMHIALGGSDRLIYVWNVLNGQMVLGPLEGHTDSISSVAYSPDGMHIASGSYDGTIRVWDARSGRMVQGPLEGHTDWVYLVVFSPDGTRIVSGSWDETICVWDARSAQMVLDPLNGHIEPVYSTAFSPDGMRIISSSDRGTIYVWDVQNGQAVLGPLEGCTSRTNSVAFSPDGMRIVSGFWNNAIIVWDAQNGEVVQGPLEGHTDAVNLVAFSPDGKRIVSTSYDSTIRVWDARNGQRVLGPVEGHTGPVYSAAFSPDGMLIVSGSYSFTVCVWDVQSEQVVLGPLQGHTAVVLSVAFSPDGTRIISGSHDRTIRIWDAQNGQMVLEPLQGHTSDVNSVAFSPDGMHIVSGSHDKTICVWDAQSGRMVLGPLNGHIEPVFSTGFSPDGTRIVSGSADKTIRIWHIPNQLCPGNSDPCLPNPPTPSLIRDHPTIPTRSLSNKPSTNAASVWTLGKDGWVSDEHNRLYLWVPPDLRGCLLMPNNTLLISPRGDIRLNFEGANIGGSWTECYSPV